jgi:hypothetical protein
MKKTTYRKRKSPNDTLCAFNKQEYEEYLKKGLKFTTAPSLHMELAKEAGLDYAKHVFEYLKNEADISLIRHFAAEYIYLFSLVEKIAEIRDFQDFKDNQSLYKEFKRQINHDFYGPETFESFKNVYASLISSEGEGRQP